MSKFKRVISLLMTIVLAASVFTCAGITASAATTYETEDNNSINDANSIGFDNTVNGQIAISGDVDYYKMTLPYSGRVTIKFNSYMRYYCIRLYNADGQEIWYTDSNEWISTTQKRSDTYNIDLEKGTYYLQINGYCYGTSYASTGNYDFSVGFTASGANMAEPNNSIAQAVSLSLSSSAKGQIALNDKCDYYEMKLPSSGRTAIKFNSYMRYYCIRLYNADGQEIWYTDSNEWISTTGKRSDTYNIDLEKGTYYLQINGYCYGTSYASTGNYDFSVSFTASGANMSEPNDSIAQANILAFNKTAKGQIALNDKCDFYKITLPSSGRTTIKINSFMRYYCIRLYNADGQEIWYTDSNEWISTTGKRSDTYNIDLEKGTYYLQINGYCYGTSYASTGNYNFKVTFAASGANIAEPNDSIEQAKTISSGSTVKGQIALNDRYDYYKFTVKASSNTKISITSYMQYYCIRIYDASGKEVWYKDGNEWISTSGKRSDTYSVALAKGTYYMQVNGYCYGNSYASTGNYTLILNKASAPAAPKGIKATSSTTSSIKLSWSKVSGAAGYRVYKYNPKTKKYEKYKDVTSTSLTVSGLKAGTVYCFRVKAYKTVSGERLWSSTSGTFKTATRPSNAKISSATTPSKGKLTAKWKAVSGASGYQVQYSTSKSFKSGVVKKYTSKTSYTASGLKSGRTYYVRVRPYVLVGSTKIYSPAVSAARSIRVK